jgi:molecular chaperone DnaK (HSP70)
VTRADASAVAIGAAMEGAILKGVSHAGLPNLQIKATTPLSIGFSLADGTASVLIPRGSILPAKHSTTTTTSRNNQSNVGFDVVEGEQPLAKDNIRLGNVVVRGIQRAPRGAPKIEITMAVGEDGILAVAAVDQITGAAISAAIQSGSNLSRGEIAEIMAERQLQKVAEWRERFSNAVEMVSRAEAADAGKRAEMSRRVEEWRRWSAEHQAEESVDVLIEQYAIVRAAAKALLSPS